MNNPFKRLIVAIALCLMNVGIVARAQQPDCAAIDLSDSIALLVEAQTQAAKGNTEDALKLIADAQAQLAAIEAQCDTPTSAALTETVVSVNGRFSISYPEGWQIIDASALIGGSNIPESVDHVAVASSEEVTAKLGKATPFEGKDGLILVLAGTRSDVARSLGVFGGDRNYDGLSIEKLLSAFIEGASPSIKFGAVKTATIDDQTVASATLQAAYQSKVIYEGVLLVTTFGEDQILAMFDFSAAGKAADAEALALAVAGSMQVQ